MLKQLRRDRREVGRRYWLKKLAEMGHPVVESPVDVTRTEEQRRAAPAERPVPVGALARKGL